jgi:hypothetical protein
MPANRNITETNRYWIPFLIVGEAVSDTMRGMRISQPSDHTGIAASLLSQLGLQHSHFPRSRKMFEKLSNPFAFYTFDDGMGLILDSSHYIYDNRSGMAIYDPVLGESDTSALTRKRAQALLQLLIEDYINSGNGVDASNRRSK